MEHLANTDTSTDDEAVVRFADLQAALSRCMEAHPPSQPGHVLHPDASKMADLWAAMLIANRQAAIPKKNVTGPILDAFNTWRQPEATQLTAGQAQPQTRPATHSL
jgi:hypothetical protein